MGRPHTVPGDTPNGPSASAALGHSSAAFTMDVYQHLLPSMQESATKAIEDALGGIGSGG